MTILQAIVLGLVQGITEFLPVSSSGHLIFFPEFFGWSDQGVLFDVMVHVATLCAVLYYSRKTVFRMIRSFFSNDPDDMPFRRLAWFVIVSMIPAGLVGYLLESNRQSATVIGVSFIVWGIALGLADKYHVRFPKEQLTTTTRYLDIKQVAAMSLAQILALIPGTSRSGITMTAGLFAGLDRRTAAEFSFLMSIPIIAAAGLMQALDISAQAVAILPLLVGFIAASLSAFLAMTWLVKFVERVGYMPFMYYRIIVGILILLVL